MEKIKQTFINLYTGENFAKKHLLYFLLLLFPALSGTAFNLIDKDNTSATNGMYGLLGLIFIPFAIPALLTIFGLFLKFIHNKLNDIQDLFPMTDKNCIKQGFKATPLFLAWCFYYITFLIFFITFIILSALCMAQFKDNPSILLIMLGAIIILLVAMITLSILLAPFVNIIFIKYAKNYEYNRDLFNPLTLIKFMKDIFKPVFIVALKFLLITFLSNIVLYILFIIAVFVFSVTAYAIGGENVFNSHFGILLIFTGTAIATWIMSYFQGIISFAYFDNITEIYKAKYLEQNQE